MVTDWYFCMGMVGPGPFSVPRAGVTPTAAAAVALLALTLDCVVLEAEECFYRFVESIRSTGLVTCLAL